MTDAEVIARDFSASIAQAFAHYAIPPVRSKAPYPLNIRFDLGYLEAQIEACVGYNVSLDVQRSDTSHAQIEIEAYLQDFSIYHLPTSFLLLPARNCQHQHQMDLIRSAYAYLQQIVGVDSYAEYSMIGQQYRYYADEYWSNQMNDDESEEAGSDFSSEKVKEQLRLGKIIHAQLKNHRHYRRFARRLIAFQPQTPEETKLLEAAQKLFDLSRQFSGRTLTDTSYFSRVGTDTEDDETPDIIDLNTAVCFIYTNDSLAEQVSTVYDDMVQAGCEVDYNSSITTFDGTTPPQPALDINFAVQLYPIIGDLIDAVLLTEVLPETTP